MPTLPENYKRHLEQMDQVASTTPHMEAIKIAQRMYRITIVIRGLDLTQTFYTHGGERIELSIKDGVWNVLDSEWCVGEGSESREGSEVESEWGKG